MEPAVDTRPLREHRVVAIFEPVLLNVMETAVSSRGRHQERVTQPT